MNTQNNAQQSSFAELAKRYGVSAGHNGGMRYHFALKTAKGYAFFAKGTNDEEMNKMERLLEEQQAKGNTDIKIVELDQLTAAMAELMIDKASKLDAFNFWLDYHGFMALKAADDLLPVEQTGWHSNWYNRIMSLYERDGVAEQISYCVYLHTETNLLD